MGVLLVRARVPVREAQVRRGMGRGRGGREPVNLPRVIRCDVCGATATCAKPTGKPAGWGTMMRYSLSTDEKEAARGEVVAEAIHDVCRACLSPRWPEEV